MNVSDVSAILGQLGSMKIKGRSMGGLLASCPLAPYSGSHKGRDENPSLIVWQDSDQKWACKCYACKFAGSILDMVDAYGDMSGNGVSHIKKFMRLDGKTDLISKIKKVPRSFDDIPDKARLGIGAGSNNNSFEWWNKSDIESINKEEVIIEEASVSEWMGKMPAYAEKRGISVEMAKQWEIGYAKPLIVQYKKKDGTSNDVDHGPRMIFLIRNKDGRIVGWSGRSIINTYKPKYIHAKGTRLSWYLYGENHIDLDIRTGYVVEGFMDVLRLSKYGYKNALAVMSGSLSKHQIEKLCSWFDEVVIVPDGDDAGLRMTLGVRERIHDRIKLRIAGHSSGLDPGDFNAEMAENLISKSTEHTGVSWDMGSGKWKAFIDDKDKFLTLGLFETELEAAGAYKEAYGRLSGISGFRKF
jgi:hypothetical protein